MLERMSGKAVRSLVRWWTIGSLVAGCAADSAVLAGDSGGQTGSLVPPTCEQEAGDPFVVPEGRTAFVEGWNDFSNPVLRDAEGDQVATSITQDADVSLIETAASLPPGDYTLTYDCVGGSPVQREITVVEAAPLPTSFGDLDVRVPNSIPSCSALSFITLVWTPDPAFLPYLDLVKLRFEIDGGDFGALPSSEPLAVDALGNVELPIPNCQTFSGDCGLTTGTYRLHAKIAGQSASWSSNDVRVDDLCIPRSEPEDIGCNVNGAPVNAKWSSIGLVVALGALVRRATKNARTPAGAPKGTAQPRVTPW